MPRRRPLPSIHPNPHLVLSLFTPKSAGGVPICNVEPQEILAQGIRFGNMEGLEINQDISIADQGPDTLYR